MKVLAALRVLKLHRSFSSVSAVIEKQNELFSKELNRQRGDVGRIEKIEIIYEGRPEKKKLFMNKNLSTPHDVAKHVAEWLTEQGALALVNDTYLWDMHRPLEDSCRIKLLTFTEPDPYQINKAFWKCCSFLLGAVVSKAFSDSIKVALHSFPSPQISSGSFIYDAQLLLDEWKPTPNELRVLSAELVKLSNQSIPLERLPVTPSLAHEIFSENQFKTKQIPDIASNSADGKIILYRIGDHIDISKGPLIGNTSFIGRCTIAAVHKVESDDGPLYRFQGVALPKGLPVNHFAYGILEERARKLNSSSYQDWRVEQMA